MICSGYFTFATLVAFPLVFCANVTESDHKALFEIFEVLGCNASAKCLEVMASDIWANCEPYSALSNWNKSLYCDPLGNVVGISVNDFALTGTISTKIAQLRHLKDFSAVRNQIKSSLPTQIGLLSSLTELALSSNLLVSTIPSVLNRLTALNYLSLNDNGLTGTVPDLGALSVLQRFYVENNLLTGGLHAWGSPVLDRFSCRFYPSRNCCIDSDSRGCSQCYCAPTERSARTGITDSTSTTTDSTTTTIAAGVGGALGCIVLVVCALLLARLFVRSVGSPGTGGYVGAGGNGGAAGRSTQDNQAQWAATQQKAAADQAQQAATNERLAAESRARDAENRAAAARERLRFEHNHGWIRQYN